MFLRCYDIAVDYDGDIDVERLDEMSNGTRITHHARRI